MTSQRRILVVDDTPDILDFLKMVFSKAGFDVVAATGGWEAFKEFQKQEFDLVLTDLQMPNGNGLDLVSDIKRSGSKTPVFMITGDVTFDTAKATAIGAEQVLLKPIAGRDLLRAVTKSFSLQDAS
jgi:DNA-binding response OmpR family regulator